LSAVNEYSPDKFITHLNIAKEARAKVTGREAHSNDILRNVRQVKIIFAILQEKMETQSDSMPTVTSCTCERTSGPNLPLQAHFVFIMIQESVVSIPRPYRF
jgi:hypothetical protein